MSVVASAFRFFDVPVSSPLSFDASHPPPILENKNPIYANYILMRKTEETRCCIKLCAACEEENGVSVGQRTLFICGAAQIRERNALFLLFLWGDPFQITQVQFFWGVKRENFASKGGGVKAKTLSQNGCEKADCWSISFIDLLKTSFIDSFTCCTTWYSTLVCQNNYSTLQISERTPFLSK